MKLEHLKLSNFRGFRSFEITFDPSFTVLLGQNMAGKSAVLDGAAVALGGFFSPFLTPSRHAPLRLIDDDEIHQIVAHIGGVPDLQRQFPVTVEALGSGRDKPLSWSRSRSEIEGGTLGNRDDLGELNVHVRDGKPLDLPVIAHYGTQRTWRGTEASDEPRGVGSRYDGYEGCFHINATHVLLASWMRKQTLVQLQRGGGYVQPQLAAVEAAVKSCIDGITRFWFDVQYDELRLERTSGDIQSFAMLSEGVRNMVAMVADIAWRTAVLNPQHGMVAHLYTDGVVLIDELDLHLHPEWQRRVVDDLRRTFPQVQFIVTTHSPQIVASVSRAQVRLLDQNRLVPAKPHVEGRDSNALLEDVFGVPSRPDDVQLEIDALFRLIEDQSFIEARRQLDDLLERLGPDDPSMIRARWLLDTEDPQPLDRPASVA